MSKVASNDVQPSHGCNALLLAAGDGAGLQARPERDADDALLLRTPPTISTDLLPYHKQVYRHNYRDI